MKRISLCLLGIAALIMCAAPAWSKPLQPGSIRVRVYLGVDKVFEAQLKSCLYRGLRNTKEVKVVEDDNAYNRFMINVVAVKLVSQANYELAYNASVLIGTPLSDADIVKLTKGLAEGLEKTALQQSYRAFMHIERIGVMWDPNLDNLCKRIVADFDAEPMEGLRQLVEKMSP